MRDLIEAIKPLPEHWSVVKMLSGELIHVGWQLLKDEKNKKRHDGLSLKDGLPVIINPENPSKPFVRRGEPRERVVGVSGNKVLAVIVAWVDTDAGEELRSVRIISVFKFDRNNPNDEGEDLDEDINNPTNLPVPGVDGWQRWGDRVAVEVARQKARFMAQKKINDDKATADSE